MKKILFILVMVLASISFSVAQTPTESQSNNEGFVGYSFVRQDVGFERPEFKFNENTDSHGANVSYTRYFGATENKAGVVGLTVDAGVNFTGNEEALVTVMAGPTVKARNNKYVQPYIRGMVGGARQNVTVNNVTKVSDWSVGFLAGAGVDFNTKAFSRYKIRVGADYINTGFAGNRQNAVRLTTGLVF